MLDVERIRADFPILSRPVNGKPLVYLDSAATSQKPRAVLDALVRYYETANANVHRGIHRLAEDATREYEAARTKVAAFVSAPSPAGVVFVRNATEAINLVARAWGDRNVQAGDEVLVTGMEHHSNLVPWHLLARRTGARVRAVPVTDDGRLDLDALQGLLSPRTRLVAVTHVSNVLGTINPVADIARLAHAAGAAVLVDGAQAVPHLPVDVAALGADFLAFSGHKMLGATGTGVLVVRPDRYDEMDPFLGGGEMIREVTLADATWADPPWRYEAGTPDVAGAVALGAAIDYLRAAGMPDIAGHDLRLGTLARQRLSVIPGLRLLGPPPGPDATGGVATFVLDGVHPHDVAQALDARGIAVRAGHHCAQPLMARYGVPATTRASFYLYNTEAEVEALADAVSEVARARAPRSAASSLRPGPATVSAASLHGAAPDDELFREVVLDHYLHPAGREPIDGPSVEWHGKNPLCGDEVTLRLHTEDGRIEGLQVVGHGCSISVASGSMLAERLRGRTLDEARRLLRGVKAMFRGEPLPADLDLGDLNALRGVKDLPVRVKCALLAWTTLEEALEPRGPAEATDGSPSP